MNTHSHSDHVSGNRVLKERTKAQIAVHESDAGAVGSVDLSLVDGDVLRLGDRSFRVVHTPGHTAGSICLYDEGNLTLLAGDSIQGRGIEEGGMYISGSREDYLRSMESLLKLRIDTLVLSHPYLPFRRAVLEGQEPKEMISQSITALQAK